MTYDKRYQGILHSQRLAFLRSRAQAKYREEEWHLTVEEFFWIWRDPEVWATRSRKSTNGPKSNGCMGYVLTRKDMNKAWSLPNTEIVTRKEQLTRSGIVRRERYKEKKNGTSDNINKKS
jgi:hypothetical protein